ncbi:hypothetical protein M5E82_10085 [Parabacteroides distasonis]|nr:hypothetical protein M5E82_10085 [Parabacteroides distasonis]
MDGIYTFEIGGKRKRYSPIEGIPDGFIVADDIKIRSVMDDGVLVLRKKGKNNHSSFPFSHQLLK